MRQRGIGAPTRGAITLAARLVFEQFPGLVSASTQGNVSAYYLILKEIRQRLVSGSFNGKVTLSTGEEKTIILSTDFVTENGEDISDFIGK